MDTRKIVTPKTKTEVELKTVLSGADEEAIEAAIFDNSEFINETNDEGKSTQKRIMKGSALQEGARATLERVVVSVGGHRDNLAARVLELPSIDSKFVQEEAAKVDGGIDPKDSSESKKTTGTSS